MVVAAYFIFIPLNNYLCYVVNFLTPNTPTEGRRHRMKLFLQDSVSFTCKRKGIPMKPYKPNPEDTHKFNIFGLIQYTPQGQGCISDIKLL